jgi:hypothetical protein
MTLTRDLIFFQQALYRMGFFTYTVAPSVVFKGIVSRDLVVCFLVSFDRSDISTHHERVLFLLKVRFRIEFFDFRVRL